MLTHEMMESIKKVEATRAERIGMNLPKMSVEEKSELLKQYHPDFREELIREAEKLHIWRRSNKI